MHASRHLLMPLALVACAAPGEPATGQQPIVNGEMTTGFPTAGVLVAGGTTVCSGTLIGCDRFLTAAHCVCNGEGSDCAGSTTGAGLQVYLQHAGFVPVLGGRVHADYSFPDNDVAVLRLSRPVTSLEPTPIASAALALGSAATIVGYGRSGGGANDLGIKQTGGVTTGACPPEASGPGHVCWEFAGVGSNTCNGDSGGPLFVERGGAIEVAGITSGGTQEDCLAGDWSYDTDVFAFRDFILDAVGETDTGGPACGELAAVGADGAITSGLQGALDPGERATLEVVVPPGTAELRLAMNATNGAAVDLFAAIGASPTTIANDCAAAGPSSYGACRIDGPASGTWQVAVDAASGGRYQLTAVVLGGGPVASDDEYQATAGTALAIDAAAGVLANDDGELSAVIARGPAHGELALAPDGSFTYTAASDFAGDDSFTYRASAAGGPSGGAVVRVAVAAAEPLHPPDAGPDQTPADDGGGCAAGGGASWLAALGLLALLARRR
jgi:hypothetical protein